MIDLLAMAIAAPVCFGYLCRMDGLNIFQHRLPVIGLHLGLFLASLAAGIHGFEGKASWQDGFVLLGAACWLGVSLHTWARGIPDHVKRQKKQALSEQTDP